MSRFRLVVFGVMLVILVQVACGLLLSRAPHRVGGSPAADVPPVPAWPSVSEPVAAGTGSPESRQITVTGDAEVRVVPDEVYVTVGVESHDKTIAATRQHNETVVAKLIALADTHGIARKDVQTDHLSLEPRYQSASYDQRIVIGYTVRRTIVYRLRDISKFEAFMEGVLGAGANYVHRVEFRTSQLRKHRDEARRLALKAAGEKAAAMAASLNQKVGRPRNIQEISSNWWSSYSSWWGSWNSGQMSQNVVQNQQGPAAAGGSDDTLAPGMISVSARVSVTFELQ